MTIDLSGEIALVTGATRGIGKAIASTLAECGATVIGTATSDTGVQQITENLKPFKGKAFQLDVTSSEQVDLVLDQITKEFGAPTILVNNAGITRDNLMMRMKDEEWSAVIDTNLTSLFRLSKRVLRPMMKARRGRIINIGSVVGISGNPGQANYGAAKAGLIGFTKSLAQEIASRGITVNVIAPGFIETDMTQALSQEQREGLANRIPMQRLGQPKDIANAVAFLASDLGSYITGETINVNGGMLMS